MSNVNFNPKVNQQAPLRQTGSVAKKESAQKTEPTTNQPSANVGESVTLSATPVKAEVVAPAKTEAKAEAPAAPKVENTAVRDTGTEPIVVLDAAGPSGKAEHNSEIDGFLTKFLPDSAAAKDVGTVTQNQFNFDRGTEVVSSAQKFIIPVPTFSETGGGEDLVYPEGAKDGDGKSIGGQPITDWKGNPIGGPGEKGVVFFNHKDQSYQAVKADGNGVVILNQVTDEQGKKLQDKIGKDPGKLSLQEFKGALEYAHSDLGVGDMYNSDRDFIKSKMNAMENSETGVPQYGLHRRDDRDVCHAVYVEGQGEFKGPAATPQKFENGAVLLRQPNSKADDGFSYRLIQPDAFKETYTNKNGTAIELDKMETQEPKPIKDNGTITQAGMNFDEGAKVVSGAQKFIIPVPTFAENGGGEDLVYPKGATDKDGNSGAGQPITDWQGKPIGEPGEKGVVFFNHKDQSYQAVKADGNGVVIMNQVTDEQGMKLQEKIGGDPGKLSIEEFKGALEYAHSDLGVGDMYNSDRDFIKSKMNAMETSETGVAQYGLHRRDDRDVCDVLFVEGKGEFQGPAATPQKFEDGAVILRQPNSKAEDGFSYRLIQPDAFKETYKNKDGSEIKLSELPRHE